MTPNCKKAVEQAAGRKLTEAEIRKIDDRLSATMRQMAKRDPAAWQAMPRDARVLAASQEAMAAIQAEADLKVTRANLQIVKTAEVENRIGSIQGQFSDNRSQALVRDMDVTNAYVNGVKLDNISQLMDLINAAESTQGTSGLQRGLMFMFDAENPGMTRDLSVEIIGNANGVTGNGLAQKGARAWLDVIERMRQRFNANGGDVGKLDYGYLPQPHDTIRVRGDGSAKAQDDWAQKTLPLLDRSQYLNEDGTRMADGQVLDFLREAWTTISTDGMNKIDPGGKPPAGSSAKANAGRQHRQIHYRDGDAYLEYMGQYGAGSMYDAMVGHVGRLARDIALIERYGPNPNAQMRLQFDLAARDAGTSIDNLPRSFGLRPQSYWDVLSGTTGSPVSGRIAEIGTHIRNIQTFGKLGGAVLSSLTDTGTYFVTTGYNNLSYWEGLKNIGKQFDSDTRDFLNMHGVIAESMISDLNRWSGDNISQNWSGRLANSTMKLSLMNWWTDSLRRAYSMTQMNGLARMAKNDWSALSEYDRWRMTSKGLTEGDWGVIRKAELSTHNGMEFLTPESIRASGAQNADQVVAKVLGLISDESEYAVLNPDLATRAIASGGGIQRGTLTGELARSVTQFKSFPIAMISRHWSRMLEAPGNIEGAPVMANRAFYGAAMMVSLTALGAIAYQNKQIVQGKDPYDMTQPKFWLRALAQGGGLGIVGDFLLTDPTENPGDSTANAIKSLAGPTIGSAFDIVGKLGVENVYQAAHGKDTHVGAEAVRVARSHLPFVGIWYGKAALDHAVLNSLNESLSPGYLSKMRQRAQKDGNADYWWRPDEGLPSRAPDFGNALGE
jgi:hypothetical protein